MDNGQPYEDIWMRHHCDLGRMVAQKGFFSPWERDSTIDPLEILSSSSLLALDSASDSWTSVKQPNL